MDAATEPDAAPRTDARSALLDAALGALAVRGPAGVHPQEICEALGLSKALVNYHFGNREGLIAEAAALGYERYVDHLAATAGAAGPNAVDQLLAWFDAQVDWTAANPGLAAFLNFPSVSIELDLELLPAVVERMRVAGEQNFANLRRLVAAARDTLHPGRKADPIRDGFDAAAIGWVTLGLSVFAAGEHLPTRDMAMRSRLPEAREHVRGMVRGFLARG